MTNWFPTGTAPVRDGCYIVRRPNSKCQHLCRWDVKTKLWYSAGSTGRSQYDVMGFNNGVDIFEWRGLSMDPLYLDKSFP